MSALEVLAEVSLVIGWEERLLSLKEPVFVLNGSLNLTHSTSVTNVSADRLCNVRCIT